MAILVPPGIVLYIGMVYGASTVKWAAMERGANWVGATHLGRAGSWFDVAAYGMTTVGVGLGICGLLAFAVRDGVMIPGMLVVTHLALWIMVPGFSWNGSATGLRTILYLLPLLAVGIGRLVLLVPERRSSGLNDKVALGLVGTGFALVALLIAGRGSAHSPKLARAWVLNGVSFGEYYFGAQGGVSRGLEILNRSVPEGLPVIAWTDEERMVYGVVSGRVSLITNPAVSSALRHIRDRDFTEWARRRGWEVPNAPFYVIADVNVPPHDLFTAINGLTHGRGNTIADVHVIAFLPPIRSGVPPLGLVRVRH
jgi:hypothetical protein